MKYLFLDYDGVMHPLPLPLVGETWFCKADILSLLLREVDNVRIVLSTSWKDCVSFESAQTPRLKAVAEMLPPDLTKLVVGATPCINIDKRYEEVNQYIVEHNLDRSKCIVLDDNPHIFQGRPTEDQITYAWTETSEGLTVYSRAFETLYRFFKESS